MDRIIELLLTTAIPSVIGFIVGSYKREKHKEELYIKNLNEALEAYNKLFDDLTKRYDEEIKTLTEKLEVYEKTIIQLELKIKELEGKQPI